MALTPYVMFYVMGREVSSKYGRCTQRNWLWYLRVWYIILLACSFQTVSGAKPLFFLFISGLSQTSTWSFCLDWPGALAPPPLSTCVHRDQHQPALCSVRQSRCLVDVSAASVAIKVSKGLFFVLGLISQWAHSRIPGRWATRVPCASLYRPEEIHH